MPKPTMRNECAIQRKKQAWFLKTMLGCVLGQLSCVYWEQRSSSAKRLLSPSLPPCWGSPGGCRPFSIQLFCWRTEPVVSGSCLVKAGCFVGADFTPKCDPTADVFILVQRSPVKRMLVQCWRLVHLKKASVSCSPAGPADPSRVLAGFVR